MKYAKFWAAALIGLAAFVRALTGFDLGVDEATATALVGATTAFVVWAVPNRR